MHQSALQSMGGESEGNCRSVCPLLVVTVCEASHTWKHENLVPFFIELFSSKSLKTWHGCTIMPGSWCVMFLRSHCSSPIP